MSGVKAGKETLATALKGKGNRKSTSKKTHIWATTADLPAEIKLKILALLDEGPRILVFNGQFPTSSHPSLKMWVAKPVQILVLLHICHETRTKALARYSTFSSAYQDYRIDFESDIIFILEKRSNSLLNKEVLTVDEKDLFMVQNIGLQVPEFDQNIYILDKLNILIGRSSHLKAIHLGCFWSIDPLFVDKVERLWVQHWTLPDGPLPTPTVQRLNL